MLLLSKTWIFPILSLNLLEDAQFLNSFSREKGGKHLKQKIFPMNHNLLSHMFSVVGGMSVISVILTQLYWLWCILKHSVKAKGQHFQLNSACTFSDSKLEFYMSRHLGKYLFQNPKESLNRMKTTKENSNAHSRAWKSQVIKQNWICCQLFSEKILITLHQVQRCVREA